MLLSELSRSAVTSDPKHRKTPATAATVRGHDRPGRGDMSKRTRWQPPYPAKDIGVPARKPVERRPKFLRSRDAMPEAEHLRPDAPELRIIDDINARTYWCIWPGCELRKIHDLPLCRDHVIVITEWEDPQIVVAREARATVTAAVDRGETIPANSRFGTGGYVYFLRVDDLIKIGYSTQPHRRLREYPPNAEVLAVIPGTKKSEAALHGRFRFALQRGREWFRPADEILEYVKEMVEHYGPPGPEYTNRHKAPGPKQTVGTRNYRGVKKTAA